MLCYFILELHYPLNIRANNGNHIKVLGQTGLSSVDPDQIMQNMACDQVLHCLPLIQQYLDNANW